MKKNYKKDKKMAFFRITAVITAIILWGIYCFFGTETKLDINIDNVSAFKISSEVITELKKLSEKYEKDFAELLTYYAIENKFFENKTQFDNKIEQNFIMNYDKIKDKYNFEQVKSYYELINNIYNEIKSFPIDMKYKNEYIYGDSWGGERTYGGKRIHKGCDIMDRENIKGRIPVISMTDGKVSNIGWNEQGGYRIGIISSSGNYYYYAHFDSYEKGIEKNKNIKCGQVLGYMGDSGYGEEGTRGKFPVHLHIGICPKTDLSEEELWINPYPFLRLIEK